MAQQSDKQTPYDQFNIEIPQKFPKEGISTAAANAIVNSETWTDANPTELRPSVPPRLACWAAWPTNGIGGRLDIRREKMPVGPNMVTGGNVQIVWKKFLRYFDVEPRIVPPNCTCGLVSARANRWKMITKRVARI
ncbi:MAG: hypothetical protein WBL39_16845 [Terrimicrobiaceae bacterium]